MKNRTQRIDPLSTRWANHVFNLVGLEQTKENKRIIGRLWASGYSHKDAAIFLAEYHQLNSVVDQLRGKR